MHQAFYRKWRPRTFDDVCGQDHITSILRYEAEHKAFSHAYLFCGSRGTGKTSCAKILAKVVNCEHPVNGNPCLTCAACRAIEAGSATDVLEMDAASNNGVDNVRDIREEVIYLPSELKYRVYIIDEVHMLSTSAFNALLKTLEEPPEHVIFILATTELQKLPATIISRCQRFDFRRISTEAMMDRLSYIAKEEGISLDPDASRMLAKFAQGGMRDAISLLELCAGSRKEITPELVEKTVGITGRGMLIDLVNAIADKQYDTLFSLVDEVVRSAKDLAVFWQDLLSLYRDLLIFKTAKNAGAYLDLTHDELASLSALASRFQKETLLYHCRLVEESFLAMQRANAVKRVLAEMTLLRMCDEALDDSNDALLSRVAKLEDRLRAGGTIQAEAPKSAPKKEVQEAPKKAPEAPAEKPPALRPIKEWAEVAEYLTTIDPVSAGFFRNARGYFAGDKVLIRTKDSFTQQMLTAKSAKENLLQALSAILNRALSPEDLSFEVVPEDADDSPLDEILDEL